MPEILDAQSQWMIGHRMPECAELIGRIQEKIRPVFMTTSRVYLNASSGTGLQEAAIRNCSDLRVLNCVNGAFSKRWQQVTEANGKTNDVLEVEWGQPVLPEQIADKLLEQEFDAITIVHNETSTGTISPIDEISKAVRRLPGGEDTMILVDSVSGLSGARLEFDAWDLDVVLTSSQKAFSLPAGLAFCAVSDRALEKAGKTSDRGYYFDFLLLEKYLKRNQTPATPAISLLYALDKQLDNILTEGLEIRFQRHIEMRDYVIAWAEANHFELFAAEGYRSPTVTCLRNTRGISVAKLNEHLRNHGMIISNGYGNLKEKTFRIAHMGDTTLADIQHLLDVIESLI